MANNHFQEGRELLFPVTGTAEEQFHFLLSSALLAPSTHNTQPWLFKIDHGCLELLADRTRALPVVDPDDRELTISCGAALFHLRLALRHFGYTGNITVFPDADNPDILAHIGLGDPLNASPEDLALFDALGKRRTNRQPFEQRVVPASVLIALQEAAHMEGAWLSIIQEEADRNAIADLIALADQMQWADPHFRRELAAWTRPDAEQWRYDGIPVSALGFGNLISYVNLRMGRTVQLGNGQAFHDRRLVLASPVLVALGTDQDTPSDWLMAGQALAHILLYACTQNVSASFLNQPIEVPEVRLMLHNQLERSGFPQLLLRLGYGPEVPPTPRRPVAEVLL